MISRRAVLTASLAPLALRSPSWAVGDRGAAVQRACAELEGRHGGRLGVAIQDTSGITRLAYRGSERFPLCSTFKVLAAGAILARVDEGREKLARRVVYGRGDLVTYSPVTERHADGSGLTMAEICEAAVTRSDNTAGNLMLDSLGGPSGLTAYLRSLGDGSTRLDRRETALNEALPGDPRDTTTPLAMLDTLGSLVLGSALSAASRAQLAAWLLASTTGAKRLRAGVPAQWRVGDKTGSGDDGTTNDVAVLWPPERPPILVAAYYTGSQASGDERSAVLAEVGRLASAP
ncbi:MAG: class A beta-lactamase [Methylobacterium sp.]|uniref:class A beta-lactamase n=1 Tax=Methylobacterium sp. TaxID=409 RepID=UPI0025D66463|nr:class A beta-lactamase [Methylobacterium sp.]MBX9931124.1 class A beta-lactamase [Methylobacterium sp.]